ncbi:denticleless protein homolog [Montipora capricornis]|uniref:denticleless protein homolog n=1 Tax=Montipora capricornis TaxID=246305 RepID=UPI0035F1D6D2
MTLLSSIWQRQLVPSHLRKAFPVDFALESFCCHKEDEHFVQRREYDVPPFACRFNKTAQGGHMLGIADEDGWVQILDTRKKGSRSIVKEWNAHENAVFDLAWMEGEQMLVTASGDQTLRLWDINHDDCLTLFKGHSCSVKSVDFRNADKFVFATGARDGNVMVWDIRCNRRSGHFNEPVNIISNAHAEKAPRAPQTMKKKTRRSSSTKSVLTTGQQSVTSVLFQGGEKLISSGAMDGQIKIWDLRKTYTNLKQDPVPFHVFPYPGQGMRKHGFSSLVLDSTHSCLFASCTNDNIYKYSCTALGQEPLGIFYGHLNSTFYVKAALSPDDQYLISGSSDSNTYIWRVTDDSAAPILMTGHLGEVTSVAWCPSDQGKVVTCSDDNSFRIWRVDLRVSGDEKSNFVGGSCRLKLSDSCKPIDDKITLSRHHNKPPNSSNLSPSQSSVSTNNLWSPPIKVITNPRLNPLSSHISTITRNPQSTNRTSPKRQNTLIASPLVPESPILKTVGESRQVCLNKSNRSLPAGSSVSTPLSPKSSVTQAIHTSPRISTVPKFESPTQLMTSWLRTNSRKRTHSDRNDTTDNLHPGKVSGLMTEGTNDKILTDRQEENRTQTQSCVARLHTMQILEKTETNSTEQKSPATSPSRKRICTDDPLNLTPSKSQTGELSPGKENNLGKNKIGQNDCEKTTQATPDQTKILTVKSRCQVPTQTKSKNWFIEWSSNFRAKQRDKGIPESLNGTNDIRDGLSSTAEHGADAFFAE